MKYCDGRFLNDQLFCLYVANTIMRQENNTSGAYFVTDKNWFGNNAPSVQEIKQQIRGGDFTFVEKLRYYARTLRGTDGYWRNKTYELQAWIDYHISRGHGPPTHFVTLTCAEFWWPDLRDMMIKLEETAQANGMDRKDHITLLKKSNQKALQKSIRRYSLYVNQYFMRRAKTFMDEYARDAMDLEYYWGRVEFAPGRGQIHLHILGIAKDKAYLHDFYRAKTETEKIRVIQEYAEEHLDMTADVQLDPNHYKYHKDRDKQTTTMSPLGVRFAECQDRATDVVHLAQDSMLHDCTANCLGEVDQKGVELRTCKYGHGTEATSGKGDTPGKELRMKATIHKDRKGIEHLLLPRTRSRKVTQHSRTLLQAWRANADLQLLIYRSDPHKPDVGEIEAVSRYCVSYAGKKNKTGAQEKRTVQDIIMR